MAGGEIRFLGVALMAWADEYGAGEKFVGRPQAALASFDLSSGSRDQECLCKLGRCWNASVGAATFQQRATAP